MMSPGGSSAYDWGDTIDEENAALLSASITDEALQALAGTRDLENVRFLQMAVDSEFVPLSCLGDRLPALEQLKLNGSSLTSLRSLGTSMTKVRVLWLCRCGLKELDNLGALPELQELYLAFNDIEKLSPLTEADQLQVLDLEANNVSEFEQIEWLPMVSTLQVSSRTERACLPTCFSPYPSLLSPSALAFSRCLPRVPRSPPRGPQEEHAACTSS